MPRLVFICIWALCFRLVTIDSMVFCAPRGCRAHPVLVVIRFHCQGLSSCASGLFAFGLSRKIQWYFVLRPAAAHILYLLSYGFTAKACLHLHLGSLLLDWHNRFNSILCSARLPRASCTCCRTVSLPRLVFICVWFHCFQLVAIDSIVFCVPRGCRARGCRAHPVLVVIRFHCQGLSSFASGLIALRCF